MDTFFKAEKSWCKVEVVHRGCIRTIVPQTTKSKKPDVCGGLTLSILVYFLVFFYIMGGGDNNPLYCHLTNHYPISLFFLFYPWKYYKPSLRWLLTSLSIKASICFSWFVPILENPNRLMRFLISNYPVLGKMVHTCNPSSLAGLWRQGCEFYAHPDDIVRPCPSKQVS